MLPGPTQDIALRAINIALSMCLVSGWQLSALAQGTPVTGVESSNSGTSGAGLSGNIDLGSSTASMTSKSTSPVTINVGGSVSAGGAVQGGTSTTIIPGQMLTPAQYIAVQQVIHTGQQTLLLSDMGTAIGGFANLRPTYASNLASLSVPQNVSINAIGFNNNSPLNVSGALNVLALCIQFKTNRTLLRC